MESGQFALIDTPDLPEMHWTLVAKGWRPIISGVSQPARNWEAPPPDSGVEVQLVPEEASILLVREGSDNHNGQLYPKYKVIILPDFKLP
jgi:hypothetical protein